MGSEKERIKSANIFIRNSEPYSFLAKSNSLLNSRLHRFDHGKDLEANIKQKSKNSEQKEKFQNLMDMVEDSCLENALSRENLIVKMNKMGTTWKS